MMTRQQAEDYFLKPLLQRDNKISWLLQYKEDADKKLEEKDLIILNLAKTLKLSGKPIAEIQQLTNLSKEEIEGL